MAFRKVINWFKYLPSCSNLAKISIPTNSPSYLLSAPQIGLKQREFSTRCFGIGLDSPRLTVPQRNFHVLRQLTPEVTGKLLANPEPVTTLESKRTLIQYSFKRGKRKTVKSIVKRFYRLDWGIWIRARAGRRNKIWRKSKERVKRTRYHVFCNAQRSWQFDKMVTKCWYKKKYYVDDPYENYHKRPNFWLTRRR